MFAKLSIYTAVVFSLLAVATPLPTDGAFSASSCSTGELQCCQHTASYADANKSGFASLLGVDLSDLDAYIAADCTPISVIGVASGNSCSANSVCCSNKAFGGLVSVGCVPVSL